MNCKSTAAFTLIELMVAVTIIAVLAGLAFAGGISAVKTAQRTQCLGHMRQIGLATINYGNDNNLDYPIADNPAWDVALDPYLANEPLTAANPVLKCPDDPRPLVNRGSFSRSYSFNGDLPTKSIQVSDSSQRIMIAEWYSGGTTGPGGAGANFQYGARFNRVVYSPGAVPSLGPTVGYHGAASNFVFADGHAESLDPRTTVGTTSMW